MIISLLNEKGGAGKTTLCLNLACYWAMAGASVLVIDADPQGSSFSWSIQRQAEPLFPVTGMAKPCLHRELPPLAENYDLTLIDAAPRNDELARSVISASDLVLIPVQPSPFDVWASDNTVELIAKGRARGVRCDAALVLNRKKGRSVLARQAQSAFDEETVPLLDTVIGDRVDFATSAAKGRGVVEVAPNSLAAREIKRLAKEIEHLTKGADHERRHAVRKTKEPTPT